MGSNTVHLLVVDAHHGAHPLPQTSEKSVLRLAEQMDARGKITRAGADHLIRTVHDAAPRPTQPREVFMIRGGSIGKAAVPDSAR